MDELYQEIILDHYKHPRNFGKIPDAEALVDEENPTCGDHIKLVARVADGKLAEVKVECQGCAICTASASIMTERVLGQPVAAIHALVKKINEVLTGKREIPDDDLGEMVALKGVVRYPLRVKCATMSWHAMSAALNKLGF